MDIMKAREVFRDFYISYFACLGLASLYHMYRRLKDPFEAYCLKTFFGLIRTSVVYGLFAAGLAMIIFIFDTLIFHTHSFIERVEIFLAGSIYVPAMLLVLSVKKGGVGRFSKGKIAAFLPVIFIPCILLGGWSILIRIRENGFTPSRYFGLAVVIFELIYMVLYLLQRILRKEILLL